MGQQEPNRKRTGPPGPSAPASIIPDKLYFRIGEVAKLCGVPAYVLRFWEGEFPQLKPNKGGTGQRLYRRRDVEMALRVKTLLYDEGYTIAGARQAFKTELRGAKESQAGLESNATGVDSRALKALQKELRDLHALLSKPLSDKPAVQSIRPARPALEKKPSPPPMQFPKPLTMAPKQNPQPLFGLFDDLPDEPA